MKIKLADGTEFEALGVQGRNMFYQGVGRDCLIFLFDPAGVELDKVRLKFTPDNCAFIEIMENEETGGVQIYENYTIRIELGESYVSQVLDGTVGQDMGQCVYVKMAQSTLAERTILKQQAAIDALVIAALEG